MRVSIRRTLRVGTAAGTPVEDLGVRPDVPHLMTRRDLQEDNADLLDAVPKRWPCNRSVSSTSPARSTRAACWNSP